MITDPSLTTYEQLFSVPEEHSLAESRSLRVKRDGKVYETRWLDELDGQDNLVARFRTWTTQSLRPPYRRQLGWERFSPSGTLLDREIRYSRRDSNDYLH